MRRRPLALLFLPIAALVALALLARPGFIPASQTPARVANGKPAPFFVLIPRSLLP